MPEIKERNGDGSLSLLLNQMNQSSRADEKYQHADVGRIRWRTGSCLQVGMSHPDVPHHHSSSLKLSTT